MWEIATPSEQKFLYTLMLTKHHVFDRRHEGTYWPGAAAAGRPVLCRAQHRHRQLGNIYTTETYRGQRVQKFLYKGMVPLSTLVKKGAVGGSLINP